MDPKAFLYDRMVPGIQEKTCQCEGEEQTARHILHECRLFINERRRWWAKESYGVLGLLGNFRPLRRTNEVSLGCTVKERDIVMTRDPCDIGCTHPQWGRAVDTEQRLAVLYNLTFVEAI